MKEIRHSIVDTNAILALTIAFQRFQAQQHFLIVKIRSNRSSRSIAPFRRSTLRVPIVSPLRFVPIVPVVPDHSQGL
jgi:hypothetical protein